MSLQQAHVKTATNTTDIATNTADIATNTAAIAALQSSRVTGPASATDNAAMRFDGADGKSAQDSALIIADTTGALSRAGGGGIPIQGTNTNNSAASGDVGEEAKTSYATVSLTTATPANVTSISVPAGDFEIMAMVAFGGAGATTSTDYNSIISTNSTPSILAANSITGFVYFERQPSGADRSLFHTHMPFRVSNASTTTYYLHASATFAISSYGAQGILRYRRAR